MADGGVGFPRLAGDPGEVPDHRDVGRARLFADADRPFLVDVLLQEVPGVAPLRSGEDGPTPGFSTPGMPFDDHHSDPHSLASRATRPFSSTSYWPFSASYSTAYSVGYSPAR